MLPAQIAALPARSQPSETTFDSAVMNAAMVDAPGHVEKRFVFDTLYKRMALWSASGPDVVREREGLFSAR
jgi:hypothetical protein